MNKRHNMQRLHQDTRSRYNIIRKTAETSCASQNANINAYVVIQDLVKHEINHQLAVEVGAQLRRSKLEHVRLDTWADTHHLHVSSPSTAFANHALHGYNTHTKTRTHTHSQNTHKHTHIHTHIHTHRYGYTRTRTHARTHARTHTHAHTHAHTHTHTHTHTYTYTHTH